MGLSQYKLLFNINNLTCYVQNIWLKKHSCYIYYVHKHGFPCLWSHRERRFRSCLLATGPSEHVQCNVCGVRVPSAPKTCLVISDSHGS